MKEEMANIKYYCKHEGQESIQYSTDAQREYAIRNLGLGLCKECQEAISTVSNLPALSGSEKQVNWANSIREKTLKMLPEIIKEEFTVEDKRANNFFEAIDSFRNESSAKWWIDNRSHMERYHTIRNIIRARLALN